MNESLRKMGQAYHGESLNITEKEIYRDRHNVITYSFAPWNGMLAIGIKVMLENEKKEFQKFEIEVNPENGLFDNEKNLRIYAMQYIMEKFDKKLDPWIMEYIKEKEWAERQFKLF